MLRNFRGLTLLMILFYLAFPLAAQPPAVDCPAQYPRQMTTPGELSPYTNADSWPIYFNRAAEDYSPQDAEAKVVVIGSGLPTPNAFRTGPSLAVVANGYPYFVDAGEGIWRGMGQAVVMHGDWLADAFDLDNLKYLFLTHLHEDHTVGIPTWILSPYKFACRTDKEIYGPPGTTAMVNHILQAWTIDTTEAQTGSTESPPDGSRANTHEINLLEGLIFRDDNVRVEAFRTEHGDLKDTFAYRFTTLGDRPRILAFGGDGHYSEGLVRAATGADILFIEAFSLENIDNTPWVDPNLSVAEKIGVVGAYHLFPPALVRVKEESGVKAVVLIHEQNYAPPEEYRREALMEEIKTAGYEGVIYSSVDGDVF